jgi:hypothetical protein
VNSGKYLGVFAQHCIFGELGKPPSVEAGGQPQRAASGDVLETAIELHVGEGAEV